MAKKTNSVFIWVGVGAVVLYLYFSGTANAATTNADGSANMVSNNQIQQTAAYENFSATAYPDGSDSTGQRYSIGYGHQIQPGEAYLQSATLSPAQAQQLLTGDFQNIVNAINAFGQSFTQGQFDALSDFGFNAGTTALTNIIATFESNGADAVPAKLQQYIYWHPVAGGPAVVNQNLVNRRNNEILTWNS